MHEGKGIIGHRESNGNRGSMSRSMSVLMPSMFPSIPKGKIVGNLVVIDINKQWLLLMST
jgi:hypothetical protein